MNKEIKIIIDCDGKVTFEAHGAKGSQCLNLTDHLEQGIGEVIERRKTGEYYQSSSLNMENRINHKKIPD
jgi:hypothetical protein